VTYQEALEKAKAAGQTNRLSSNRLDLAEGDAIVGRFLGRTLIKSTKKGYPDSWRYTFALDSGPADVFFSHSFDENIGADLHEDNIYHIRYDEKVKLADNKSFKKYTVEHILLDVSDPIDGGES
jgi:hypothetical protein